MTSGAQPASYQWRFNGADLPGATTDALALTNLQFAQAGVYQLVVSNSYGSITSKPAKLTIQSALTFKADGTYSYKLNTKKISADQVIANGVTIESGAQFSFTAVANKKLTNGSIFTAINNTSANPISGAFANLPDGSTFTAGRNKFQVSYEGGDGNDLTLTVQ